MMKTRMVISAVFFILCLVMSDEARAQKLQLLFWDPAKNLVSSGVDTTNVTKIAQMIDSSDSYVAKSAALFLASHGFSGVAQRIEARFMSAFKNGGYSPTDLADFLVSLYLLEAPETQQLCKDFLDTLAARRGRGGYFPSEVASKILSVLLNQGDYSRFSLLEVTIQESLNRSYPLNLDLILAYARKPELRPVVFSQVSSLANNSNARIRKEAIFLFSYFIDIPETRDILQSIATMDNTTEIRLDASALLTSLYSDPIAVTVDQQIATSTADTATFARAIIEMIRIRSPLGLRALKNTQASLSPGYFLDFVSLTISSYQPPRPPVSTPLLYMVDSLRSFIDEVSSFDWLGDKPFVNELDNGLVNAKKHLAKGDSVNAYKEVQTFQDKVNKEYEKTVDDPKKRKPRDKRFVTIEAWKFLYYNAQYIMDRLPGGKKK
jgi:hypothetical protein